jgi:hypothetical protein
MSTAVAESRKKRTALLVVTMEEGWSGRGWIDSGFLNRCKTGGFPRSQLHRVNYIKRCQVGGFQ